ncbi:MAG: exonuclease SbcCD subunit D C-terminal domain-containing protein [Bacteroidaceae bacterium]
MKIIHTADWHLGNTFHGHDRHAEFQHFLQWLTHTLEQEQADALLLTGDVFDNANPPAIAEQMYYDFLDEVNHLLPQLQIVVTAGNHDSALRIEAPAALLRRHGVTVRGCIGRTEKGEPNYQNLLIPLHAIDHEDDTVLCVATPFLRQTDLPQGKTLQESTSIFFKELMNKACKMAGKNTPILLAAHLYATGAEVANDEHSERLVVGGQECIDVTTISNAASYIALGHIHKAQRVGGKDYIRYAGSALPMSFTERNYKHGVDCITFDAEGVNLNRIAYTPLCTLLSIPEKGSASASEILEQIEALPKIKKNDSTETYPYLEIKVKEEQPEPTLARQITNTLENKAVHFCRITRECRSSSDKSTYTHSSESLNSISPLQMAQRVFSARFDGEMPHALVALFTQAENEAVNRA